MKAQASARAPPENHRLREAHGPFKHLHDLEKVPGVGRDVLEKNHGRIAVK